MSETHAKSPSLAPPLWLLGPVAVLCGTVVLGLVILQQAYFPLRTHVAVGAMAGMVFGTLLVLGPSRLVLTLVFLLALLDHQFRSPIIIPFGGVEWHPREVLLIVLLLHAAVKAVQLRFWLRWTPLHVAMLLYTAVFAYAAWRGLWLGNDLRAIIAECRAPLFLGAFWVFAGTVRSPRDLYYYGYLALSVTAVLATATLGAFAYFAIQGPVPNTQNALGEFVPRLVAGYAVQSIRPSGHAWFEAALVIAVAMMCCPAEPWYRKAISAGLATLFAAAIAAGMMRTALVSVLVSLFAMVWLSLPRPAIGLVLSVVLFTLGAVAFAGLLENDGVPGLPFLQDRSLNARAVETAGALAAIREEPLFGSGFGASFEVLGLAQKDSASSAVPVACFSLHNSWIYLLWKGGLVGLGLALVALGGMLVYSQHIVDRLPSMSQRCLGRALQAVLIGQLVASIAMPRLTYANGALFLGIWVMAMVLLEREAGETARAFVSETQDGLDR